VVLWFVGLAPLSVWAVFRSPALDYRLVIVGSMLPLLDAATGGAWVLHTLVAGVTALVLVMALTRHRRLLRRRALGVPIGLLVHLVLDGTWAEADRFWWPLLGGDAFGDGLPEVSRSPALAVAMEVVGVAALWWSWRRFGLDDERRRRLFLRTGQLDRAVAGSP
jgi:hypothetical protein